REARWDQKLLENLKNPIRAVCLAPNQDEPLPWPYDTFELQAGRRTGRLIPASDSLESVVRGAQLVRDSIATAFGPQGGLVSVTQPNRAQDSLRRGYAIARSLKA